MRVGNKYRMIFLCLFVFHIFLLVPSVLVAETGHDHQIKTGDYLREDYISIINSTHSPANAASRLFNEPTSITAEKSESGFKLIFGYNFHEGGSCVMIKENGDVSVEWDGGADFSNLSVVVNDDNSLIFSFGKHKYLKYIFVADENRFVSKQVLVGDYIDAKNNHYSFREDGSASFGEISFKYNIGLDYVERAIVGEKMRDYFSDAESRDLYEFEFKDGILNIYRTSGEMAEIVDEKPFISLHSVKK